MKKQFRKLRIDIILSPYAQLRDMNYAIYWIPGNIISKSFFKDRQHHSGHLNCVQSVLTNKQVKKLLNGQRRFYVKRSMLENMWGKQP